MDILGRGTFASLETRINPHISGVQISSPLYGSRETLISLGVVVFQTDLQFDGLDEVARFFGRGSKEFLDGAPHA